MGMSFKLLLMVVLALLITACATPIKKSEWPTGLPPYDFFQSYYRKDPAHMQVNPEQSYLKWIKNFYLGSIYYPKGWLDVTRDVLATLPDDKDKKIANEKLYLVGKGSSAEWAKDRNHRLINLHTVIVWGNAINESLVRKQQISTLDKILNDINALLAKEIESSVIKLERYFPKIDVAADEDLFTEGN